jgi:D-hexose-6-phosphate mutarotase
MSTKSVELTTGNGNLPLLKIRTPWSAAEIYLPGAHDAGFQKTGEPPLLFMSRKSHFAAGEAIRGGVPICFPWFGNRDGGPSHGFARIMEWQLVKTATAQDGAVTLRFSLPQIPGRDAWKNLRAEYMVTVAGTLTMELIATNESPDKTLEFENCLHTYFHVGDISQVSIAGLQSAPFDDFAAGAAGARKAENDPVLRILKETNRIYPDNTSAVEIHDEKFRRTICVEKSNSNSTVVWNPWTTQKLPDDFDPAEHKQMVCVESGNVKQNKIFLAPGKSAALKVVLSSALLK